MVFVDDWKNLLQIFLKRILWRAETSEMRVVNNRKARLVIYWNIRLPSNNSIDYQPIILGFFSTV